MSRIFRNERNNNLNQFSHVTSQTVRDPDYVDQKFAEASQRSERRRVRIDADRNDLEDFMDEWDAALQDEPSPVKQMEIDRAYKSLATKYYRFTR